MRAGPQESDSIFYQQEAFRREKSQYALSWVNSGFSADNSVQIFSTDFKAREKTLF